MKIILLASFPRSGNQLVRGGIEDIYKIPTFAVYPEDRKEGYPAELILYQGNHPNATLVWNEAYSKRINKPDIAFIKTHEGTDVLFPYPVVHIVRDGRDALISYAHFLGDIEGDKRPYLEILQHQIETSAWSILVMAWSENPNIKHVARFEKLLQDPIKEIIKIGDVANLKRPLLKNIKLRTFAELHRVVPLSVRRGKTDSWKDKKEMPKDLHELFWEHNKDAMDLLGYK